MDNRTLPLGLDCTVLSFCFINSYLIEVFPEPRSNQPQSRISFLGRLNTLKAYIVWLNHQRQQHREFRNAPYQYGSLRDRLL
jgi:hypothetical protein